MSMSLILLLIFNLCYQYKTCFNSLFVPENGNKCFVLLDILSYNSKY